jgi:hypothetical protein
MSYKQGQVIMSKEISFLKVAEVTETMDANPYVIRANFNTAVFPWAGFEKRGGDDIKDMILRLSASSMLASQQLQTNSVPEMHHSTDIESDGNPTNVMQSKVSESFSSLNNSLTLGIGDEDAYIDEQENFENDGEVFESLSLI